MRSSRTNNPTLNWCVDCEQVTPAQAAAMGGDITGLEDQQFVIVVRDTKHPDHPPQVYSLHEVAAFFLGVRDGEFDVLIPPEVYAEVEAAQPASPARVA